MPCENPDCDLCNPAPTWEISTVTVRRIQHTRKIKAVTQEEALRIYEDGTAWPSSYDEQTLEVLEGPTKPEVVEHPPDPSWSAEHDCWNRPGMEEFLARGIDDHEHGHVRCCGADPEPK